jgi:hypothetical protein
MSRELPAMAPFADLLRIAARAASCRVVAGSRRNALAALEARHESLRHDREVLAALPAQAVPRDVVPVGDRRSSA